MPIKQSNQKILKKLHYHTCGRFLYKPTYLLKSGLGQYMTLQKAVPYHLHQSIPLPSFLLPQGETAGRMHFCPLLLSGAEIIPKMRGICWGQISNLAPYQMYRRAIERLETHQGG